MVARVWDELHYRSKCWSVSEGWIDSSSRCAEQLKLFADHDVATERKDLQ